ncbi:MAG TPA: anthrone oxygenase family protein [Nocardioides sp.]|nr:anthrone oxygenase family protein [Nocardioides sp.]
MTTRRRWLLGAAALTTGLNAGVYFGWATGVMPGLANASDHTFVETMNEINGVIVNPAFMSVLLGAPVLTGIAAFTEKSAMRPWLLAAFGANVATILVTMGANVPLNDTLYAVDLAKDNPHQARQDFETPWVAWNIVRTLTSTAATALLVRAFLSSTRQPAQTLTRQ